MTVRVTLPGRLDSAAAVALAEELRTHKGADVVLDASEVSLLGARAMQTLLVAARAWRDGNRSLTVAHITPEVRRQLSDLGLSDTTILEGAAP